MNYRIHFTNAGTRKIQIMVASDNTRNFELDPGQTDSATLMPEATQFTFYWRDDGNPCRDCSGPGCAANTVTMPAKDIGITLPDPAGRWPKQTI